MTHVYHFTHRDVAFVRVTKCATPSVLKSFFRGEPYTVLYGVLPAGARTLAVTRHPVSRFRSIIDMVRIRYALPELAVRQVLTILSDDGLLDPAELRRHFRPMTNPEFHLDQVDRIFQLERLASDWAEIAHFAGCTAVPRQQYHSAATARPSVLSESDEAQIRAYFAEDLRRFNYS